MSRQSIDLTQLDDQLQCQLAQHGSSKDFRVVLWRQEPDATGSNWNARIERSNVDTETYPAWWDIVPQMRGRFNLL